MVRGRKGSDFVHDLCRVLEIEVVRSHSLGDLAGHPPVGPRIAERFYGDGSKYQVIADASNIPNPDLIHPGQVLTIP